MRKFFWLVLFLVMQSSPSVAQKYRRLHRKAMVADSHNDFLSVSIDKNVAFDQDLTGITQSDLNRMKKGGIDLQIFSIWCDQTYTKGKAYAHANREIDSLYSIVSRNSSSMMMVRTAAEMNAFLRSGKLGAMIGVEGGHMIEDDLSKLDSLFSRGARYLTLTWNNSVPWASSAMDETIRKDSIKSAGLNEFGRKVVARMNELGMMVDVSHVGEKTFYDVMQTTTKPVMASHSCAWALNPSFRNLKDEQILAIGKNNGVIQLNFYSGFLDSNFSKNNQAFFARHKAEKDSIMLTNPVEYLAESVLLRKYPAEIREMRPSISLLIDHIDHIVKLIGVDHVGLGSDFDGISSSPKELNDVADMPLVTAELLKRGYSKKSIKKILGENFIRVFRANVN
ncbi:dipeptidase [Pollutibacter soli]|uniref:dipeptidase n=1 Tax=Pollutibacter soli TaxID=3034157 RepID=UPI003013C92F